jgi:hypothetical protein
MEKVKATIKTTINGKEDIQSFEGTDAEVQAKIDAAVIISVNKKMPCNLQAFFILYFYLILLPFLRRSRSFGGEDKTTHATLHRFY